MQSDGGDDYSSESQESRRQRKQQSRTNSNRVEGGMSFTESKTSGGRRTGRSEQLAASSSRNSSRELTQHAGFKEAAPCCSHEAVFLQNKPSIHSTTLFENSTHTIYTFIELKVKILNTRN